MSKKITLKSGVKATLVEMSVDEFDKCMEYVNSLRKDNCDYSLRIEDWNEDTESVEHFVFKYFENS